MKDTGKVKPGYKTTEAWSGLGAAFVVMFNMDPEMGAMFVAGLVAIYNLGRSIVKGMAK